MPKHNKPNKFIAKLYAILEVLLYLFSFLTMNSAFAGIPKEPKSSSIMLKNLHRL